MTTSPIPDTPRSLKTKRPSLIGESGYPRLPDDAYFTPPWCVEALLDRFPLRGPIWEPAAGRGNISGVLAAHGYEVRSTDLRANPASGVEQQDFLADARPHGLPATAGLTIVTNPPYTKTLEFLEHALAVVAKHGGQAAFLLRADFDHAKTINHLFTYVAPVPFATKIVLTARPYWTPSRKATPRHNYAWFVWDTLHSGLPYLRYQSPRVLVDHSVEAQFGPPAPTLEAAA